MGNKNIDANPGTESSPAPDTAVEMATDALGDSSPPKSTAAASDKPRQTMESVIMDAYKKSTGSSPQEPKTEEVDKEAVEEKEDATSPEEETTEEEETRLAKEKEEKVEKKPEGETEDTPEQEKTEKADEKGPVPYERFQEVVAKREEAETKLKEIEPIAVQHQRIMEYCSSNSISPEQFSNALELAALFNTDPAKALERLTPIVNELQGFTGNLLPQDLQAEVDGGDLPLARAREIAQLRAQQTAMQRGAEHREKLAKDKAERDFQLSLAKSADAWEVAKSKIDPDYKPKAKESDPDGKWEFTKTKFLAMLHQQDGQGRYLYPIRTAQDMATLLEKAYLQVSETFGSIKKNGRQTIKPLTRTGSSEIAPKTPLQAKSMDEAMKIAAARHGFH